MVPHMLESEAKLVDEAIDLLCSVPAAEGVPARPALLLGFLKEAGVAAIGTLAALVAAGIALKSRWAIIYDILRQILSQRLGGLLDPTGLLSLPQAARSLRLA